MKKLKVQIYLIAILIIASLFAPLAYAEKQNEYSTSHLQFNDSQVNVDIQKGFSLVPDNDYYQIPIGSIIYYSSNGTTRVFDSKGIQLLIVNDSNTQKIPTSTGDRLASSIIQIPSGSLIKESASSTEVILSNESILSVLYGKNLSSENEKSSSSKNIVQLDNPLTGYIEKVNYFPVNNLGYFIANWTLPSSPPNPGFGVQTELWNGISPTVIGPGPYRSLIQPVTSWTRSNHWQSYVTYVNSYNTYFETPTFGSDVGDAINGEMRWFPSISRWRIIVWDYTKNLAQSNISVEAPEITKNNLEVMCVLEGHNIAGNSDLPGSMTFNDIQLKTDIYGSPISFNWYPSEDPTFQALLHTLHADAPSQSRATLFTNGDKIGTFNNGNWKLDYNLDGISDMPFTFGTTGDIPIIGDWDTGGRDGIAYFTPSTGYWHFDYQHNGLEDKSFRYGGATDRIIKGDWDGDERDGIAIFRPSTGYWYFDYNLDGVVDKSFRYGGSTDQIIAGNWWVHGTDGIAIFRPSTGYWYFDYNLDGVIDKQYRYGGVGDQIIKGDWDGDGKDGIAIFRTSTGYWYFDYNLDGVVDKSFRYGGSTDIIIKGDWDGDGKDGIAIYRPSTQYWYFDYNLDGVVDYSFRFGTSSDTPIVGKWY